jgi:hypothetical protein
MKNITTDNFTFACVLHYDNFKLTKIDKTDPKRAVFHFTDTQDCAEYVSRFWRGENEVEPRGFVAAQKDLKSMLYDDSYR